MSRQESIIKWLGGNSVKPYFYLDWDITNLYPTKQATWYNTLPEKTVWKKVVKIGYRDVLLCSNYEPLNNYEGSIYEGTIYDSFLQSHLQKCVRRKNARGAVYTADLLLEINPVKLLRRIPIIMIEDTFCHESFSTIVWLMCSLSIKNNLRYLHENQKRWILGVVYLITTLNYKEVIENSDEWIFQNNLSNIHKLNNDIQDLIYSIEVRKCYGCTKGDIHMFQSYQKNYLEKNICAFWLSIFCKKVKPIYTKRTEWSQNEWLLEAYDFHCNPYILTKLEQEFPEYDEEEHKNAIWYNSSGINVRIYVNINNEVINKKKDFNEYTVIWNKIKKIVQQKAWGYIQGMLEYLKTIFPGWINYTPYIQTRTEPTSLNTLIETQSNLSIDNDNKNDNTNP